MNQHSLRGEFPSEISITKLVNNVKIYNYDLEKYIKYDGKDIIYDDIDNFEYEIINGYDLNDYIKYNNNNFIKIYEQKKERGAGSSSAASSSKTNITQKNINIKSIYEDDEINVEYKDNYISDISIIYEYINRKKETFFV